MSTDIIVGLCGLPNTKEKTLHHNFQTVNLFIHNSSLLRMIPLARIPNTEPSFLKVKATETVDPQNTLPSRLA
jgi:hypothetical protein